MSTRSNLTCTAVHKLKVELQQHAIKCRAVAEILRAVPGSQVKFRHIDLESFRSVATCSADMPAQGFTDAFRK